MKTMQLYKGKIINIFPTPKPITQNKPTNGHGGNNITKNGQPPIRHHGTGQNITNKGNTNQKKK